MGKFIRALAALALVTVLAGARAEAAPQPEGDTFAANVNVDIRVIGNPPPGTQVVLEAPNVPKAVYPFNLDNADNSTSDAFVVAGQSTAPVLVQDLGAEGGLQDGGADAVRVRCLSTEGNATCRVLPPGDFQGVGLEYGFPGGQPAGINSSFTFVFGTCDGRAITGEVPTAGNDVLLGTPGPDTINGLGGDDRICGGGGVDTIRGGDGRDRIFGGGGNDRLEGGAKGDTILGAAGADTILGQAGNDALDGGAQSDTCNGGTEQDTGVRCEVRNGIP